MRAWKHGDQTRRVFETYDYSTLLGRARTHTLSWHRDRHEGTTVESDFGESEHYFDYTAFFWLFPGATLDSPFFFPFDSFLIFCTRLLLSDIFFFAGFSGLQSNRDGMMMILLISITILFFLKLLRTDIFPPRASLDLLELLRERLIFSGWTCRRSCWTQTRFSLQFFARTFAEELSRVVVRGRRRWNTSSKHSSGCRSRWMCRSVSEIVTNGTTAVLSSLLTCLEGFERPARDPGARKPMAPRRLAAKQEKKV